MATNSDHEATRKERVRAMRQRTAQLEREGMYWTEDEKEQLRQSIWDDVDITEIALNLQRTEMAVLQQAQLMGLYGKARNCPPRKQKGKCLCEQCLQKGTCASYLDRKKKGTYL